MRPYRLLFDHALTRTDPEQAHHAAFAAIRAARPVLTRLPSLPSGHLWRADRPAMSGRAATSVPAMGLMFPNALGLAAGFDKNGVGIDALAALGFGHVEVGTVTGEPQPGNPKPRLSRLPTDRAIVNRMGFNNDGAEVVARRLAARRAKTGRSADKGGRSARVVVGVNIGKTKVVPEDDLAAVIADHEKSTCLLAPHADYLVVNVSSPNTPGLRTLQAVDRLEPLLAAVRRRADEASPDRRVPLLVKIAPDLADEDVLAVADLAATLGLDGITATNTTISREGLTSSPEDVAAAGAGGLSGAPLAARSLEVLHLLRERVAEDLAIISVGGITTVDDARARLAAGATLVQGYTALVYEGPLWPSGIARGLARR